MPSRLTVGSAIAALAAATFALAGFVQANHEQTDHQQAELRHRYAPPARLASDVTADGVWKLGERLFFDTRLSASSTLSCASCHKPDQSWTDHLSKAVGEAHKPLAFRAPTLLNAGLIERYGWTGRFADVEDVAFFAMSSPANMNITVPELLARLASDPSYAADFHAAFADGKVTKHNVGVALSRFVGSIASAAGPFDRWVAGDSSAIDAHAARGFALFNGKARCAECHKGWAFTDGSFHDVGIGRGDDIGRGKLFPNSIALRYAFKTPTLRGVAQRSPYMHDGSIGTLAAVVDHYDKGGIDRPSRAPEMQPLHLTEEEKQDLVAFLESLSGATSYAAWPDN